MAENITNKSISSTNSGFPEYLNFDKLRSEAIAYLGNISGKIWTDYNVHDPGITILEALIYALLDLGYRTNLPAVDLFTRSPDDTSKDNNFFTPAQILSNNPLTITDYRKLLTDIEGVKNAWLEIDENTSVNFCERHIDNHPANNILANKNAVCRDDLLNGLYHVFIQTEKDFETNIPEEKEDYNSLIAKIKCALLSHRNLCEDFIDLKILCKFSIGLCADIELEPDADGEEIYLKIAEALREFFSPSPKFYTLQQLLEKNKPVEEIFAGRPFNITESHGFVDTEEFENIDLKRSVHLSDVYHVILDIDGVKNVRNLSWKSCDNKFPINDLTNWNLQLPQNHIPEFSVACSGFQFFKYGMKVTVERKKYDAYLNMSTGGKVLYRKPSPYLDGEIPQGIFRNDLADYYSIQNEFPSVYGISEGALRSDATDERKAQALQLQGFLLFFDQLLANYLTQLKNIRSLFALSSDGNESHTYFINQLTNVPQFQKMLRFKTGEKKPGTTDTLTILAYPTSRKKLEDLIKANKLKDTDIERNCNEEDQPDFPQFPFCFSAVRDQAVQQLKEDLLNGSCEPVVTSNNNECFFFYIVTSSPDFVLISKHYYKKEKEALNAAASVKYTGTFEENFRNFMDTDCISATEYFSFDINLSLDSYAKYLQLIIENETLYMARRQGFLDHLLARFAETFTDFALLGSELFSKEKLQKEQIKAEEAFLVNYDDLSSNRGKAYDYLCNGWENNNISGFEKRVKALAGIEDWRKHYLCNFIVEETEKLYTPVILLQDKKIAPDVELNKTNASSSVESVYKQLNNFPSFNIDFVDHENAWQLFIKDDVNNKYAYSEIFTTKEEAARQQDLLAKVFSHIPTKEGNIFIFRYIFKIEFLSYDRNVIAEYTGNDKGRLTDKEIAENKRKELANEINLNLHNAKLFTWKEEKKIGNLLPVNSPGSENIFIDENGFEFYDIEDVNLRDDRKFRFKFRDINKKILFESVNKYDTETLAHQAFETILPSLAVDENYEVKEDKGKKTFSIFIKVGDEPLAFYYESFGSNDEAKYKIPGIINEVNLYTYLLVVSEPVPDQWKFKFVLADMSGNEIEFDSKAIFYEEESALNAAKKFYSDIPNLKLHVSKGNLLVESENARLTCIWNNKKKDEREINEIKKEAAASLQFHKNIVSETRNVTDEKLNEWHTNRNENYKFKLVDKDNPIAEHTPLKSETNDSKTLGEIKNLLLEQQYSFIDFNTSGDDIVCLHQEKKTKRRWYHYQFTCVNKFYSTGDLAGKELVLFESMQGFETEEEALKAFKENFFIVLRKARSADNYGVNKFISFKEKLVNGNSDTNCDGVVFIPKKTMEEFGGYEVQKLIIPIVKSYPVKYISDQRYRFVLFNTKEDRVDWRSIQTFSSIEETMQNFQYFLILLKYEGNFHIEYNRLSQRFTIYIREVLAESLHGFQTCEAAWGAEGIEKFICISQSKDGFHNYFDTRNCSNSFFVACAKTGLIHPCKYETSKRRDAVLKKLYLASSFNFFDLLQLRDDSIVLLDLERKAIARIFIKKDQNKFVSGCDQLVDFFECVFIDENYIIQKERIFYLQNANAERIGEPVSTEITLNEWKRQLKKMACYFPLLRKEISRSENQRCNYRLQIQLPGFDSCEDDDSQNECNCREKEDECKIGCYVAWKSDCCFDSCCEALLFYSNVLKLIRNYKNYKRVYECGCGDYGIELHPEKIALENEKAVSILNEESFAERWLCNDFSGNENLGNIRNDRATINDCRNEIVAINPQKYPSVKMACDAVKRAGRLINSEGLHLVEHILLRPHCKNVDGVFEECDCDALPRPCVDEKNICHFEWVPGGESNPCEEDKKICFAPGYDPYSFIATLALPAWPQRFRSKTNRAIIEKLLQREAPAHVLLRTLWLNPRDFCCFEYYFKRWNEWLAGKLKVDYDNCNFLEFLFHKKFNYLDECEECIPCRCDTQVPDSCFENEEEPCSNFNLTEQLNNLYCWKTDKEEYAFENCENCGEEPFEILNIQAEKIEKLQPSSNEKENAGSKENLKKNGPVVKADEKERAMQIQSRTGFYHESVKKLVDTNPKNPAAKNGLKFLSVSDPTAKQYEELINKIDKNKTDKIKNIKALSRQQKQLLIENITWQYLDRIYFSGRNSSQLASLQSLFNHLRKNKIDMHALVDGWKIEEVEKPERGVDVKEIKKYLLG
jgi:uncharacterized protein YegP (UPF0339 family)